MNMVTVRGSASSVAEGPIVPMERRGIVRSLDALLLVSLLIGGCALAADRASQGTTNDMTDPYVADHALRSFFQETFVRWQEVQSVWHGKDSNHSDPASNDRARTFLETEYDKFSTDALMLYLRGNWFDDLEHSMHSLRVIVLNGESATGCGPGRDIPVPELGLYTSGTLDVPYDMNRDFLYRAKAWWNEAGTRIHSRQITEDLPYEKVTRLKDLNQRFVLAYNETLRRFLAGRESSDLLGPSFDEMTALRSQAEVIFGE